MPDMVELYRGKTKIVRASQSDSTKGEFEALDQVTWDNEHRESMPGKGIYATTTTVCMFELLKEAGIPVAYTKQVGPRTFRGPICDMIPLEVIVRDSVDEHSSYRKRHPNAPAGMSFDTPVVEFFLKTDTAEFRGIPLPDTDPFIGHVAESGVVVYHPKRPLDCGVLIEASVLGWDTEGMWPFDVLERHARNAFVIVRDEWKRDGFNLKDWKVEFGIDSEGTVLLADVIDNDSWRIEGPDGKEYSKQNVRNGKDLREAIRDYEYIAHWSTLVLARSRHPSDS